MQITRYEQAKVIIIHMDLNICFYSHHVKDKWDTGTNHDWGKENHLDLLSTDAIMQIICAIICISISVFTICFNYYTSIVWSCLKDGLISNCYLSTPLQYLLFR